MNVKCQHVCYHHAAKRKNMCIFVFAMTCNTLVCTLYTWHVPLLTIKYIPHQPQVEIDANENKNIFRFIKFHWRIKCCRKCQMNAIILLLWIRLFRACGNEDQYQTKNLNTCGHDNWNRLSHIVVLSLNCEKEFSLKKKKNSIQASRLEQLKRKIDGFFPHLLHRSTFVTTEPCAI